jgi:poly(A) polymerase
MNRVGLGLRDIISQQSRVNKIPGRRPDSFVARKDFYDIIEYSRITRGDRKDIASRLEWWTAQAKQQPVLLSPPDTSEKDTATQRKKKRRRRGKPKAQETI